MVFTVLVGFTDRTLDGDGFRTFPTTVTVAADTATDATLVAAQMVAAIRAGLDGMVVSTAIVGVAI